MSSCKAVRRLTTVKLREIERLIQQRLDARVKRKDWAAADAARVTVSMRWGSCWRTARRETTGAEVSNKITPGLPGVL